MLEVIFLFTLTLIWIAFATLQDLRTREIANWLSFSLIIFALGFRFFYSLFTLNFGLFYQGLIGLGIFFILGNLLYYGKMFAGGDAKLFIALGAVLPISDGFFRNIQNFLLFFIVFLLVGAIYSIVASGWLCFRNYQGFKKEFKKQFKTNKRMLVGFLLLSIVFVLLGYLNFFLFFLGILAFILPYLYLYAKAVDETAMIKNIETKNLREGDWLYKDVGVKNRLVRANWEGLKKEEISLLRKRYKKVLIREGVPFSPVFLISFPVFFYLWFQGLGYSFW